MGYSITSVKGTSDTMVYLVRMCLNGQRLAHGEDLEKKGQLTSEVMPAGLSKASWVLFDVGLQSYVRFIPQTRRSRSMGAHPQL